MKFLHCPASTSQDVLDSCDRKVRKFIEQGKQSVSVVLIYERQLLLVVVGVHSKTVGRGKLALKALRHLEKGLGNTFNDERLIIVSG